MSGSFDNPFSEPGDDEKTIIQRPNPGGRRSEPLPRPDSGLGRQDSPPRPEPSRPEAFRTAPISDISGPLATGQSLLIVAAQPLLQLLARLGNTSTPPDPGELRANTLQVIRQFETACRNSGIETQVMLDARYALCASIDDLARHTAWGQASVWQQSGLVATLHRDVISGELFFQQLKALEQDPALNLPLLELMYYCLALGYQGMYRLERNGPAVLENTRENLYETLRRHMPTYESALSPHWRGVEAEYRPARASVPVWVMAIVAFTLLGLAWLFLSSGVGEASDAASRRAGEILPQRATDISRPPPPLTPAPPLPWPKPVATEAPVTVTLHRFLEREIADHLVEVQQTPTAITVRIFSSGMFAVGKATLRPDLEAILGRIGTALNEEPGDVLVAGHTDSTPVTNPVPFRDNQALSLARAQAARDVLARTLRDPARLTVQGFADRQPVQDNATEQHRAENRRIEVILQRRSA